mgnify:CR=1 FL=1
MLAAALLVFREVLEAALVVTIVLAATRGLDGRGRWVASGVAAGVLGALLVALSAERIANAMEGVGQEIFNAGVLLAAVLMLAWHAIWMSHHGRELAAQMKSVGGSVGSGARPPSALLPSAKCSVTPRSLSVKPAARWFRRIRSGLSLQAAMASNSCRSARCNCT